MTSWLRKLPIALKAMLAASSFCLLVGAGQVALLSLEAPWWIVALVPAVFCGATAYTYTARVVRFRAVNFGAGLMRVADGDLETELPPAPDSDLVPLRDAFVRMAAALRETTGRLRETDLARRQLFRDLAHELGTPAQTLVALADALCLPQIDADAAQLTEIAQALVEEGARLSRLVGDVRELAELDDPAVPIERARADIGALVKSAVQGITLAHDADVQVEAEQIVIEADGGRVGQIAVNLVGNALRYAHGGVVRVVVDRDGSWARLTVDDDGEGVPDEMLGRLGERLVRVDPSRSRRSGGSGLGLSIVRAIAERHGGSLAFERSPLGGLRAVVRLPI